MTKYIFVKNESEVQYPYTFSDLKKDNPNTSFPLEISNEVLAEFNVYQVQKVEPPVIDNITQTLTEIDPQYVDDKWVQVWTISNATEQEVIERKQKREQDYASAIQSHIDATAQDRQYSDGISLASYDNSTNATWALEAQTFIAWRDAVWTYAFIELEKVRNGTRPQPSIEEFLLELPVINW